MTNIYSNTLLTKPLIIANGQTQSPFFDTSTIAGFGSYQLLGFLFPSTFPAATVTLLTQFSVTAIENVTWTKLFNNGTQNLVSLATDGATNMDISIAPYFLAPNSKIAIRSSVAMSADTTIYLNLQPVFQGAA